MVAPVRRLQLPRLHLPRQQQPFRRLRRLPNVISGVSAPNQVLSQRAFRVYTFLKQAKVTD